MSRFLQDLQNLDWQTPLSRHNQDTLLRGDYPRFSRTVLPDGTKSVIPRKWPLASIPQETVGEDPEQCSAQKFRHPNCVKIGACPLISKEIYSGDRFLPCRRDYNSEMAHYLLTKDDTTEDTNTIDIFKQVDSLDVTYRRKALRAMMVEQNLMPDLNQDKILRFSGSTVRPRKPPRPEHEKKGNWKCVPRKRMLIGSADKMLCIPDREMSNSNKTVDWSCNDMIAVTDRDHMTIYNSNGEKLSSYIANMNSDVMNVINEITVIKWSNDGTKLIMSMCAKHFFLHYYSTLVLYNLRDKILWKVVCKCSIEKDCVIRCICWSAHDRHIVTGCTGKISIYASDTGKLLHSKHEHTSDILTLSFSPNFKYLVSTAQDKNVRVFTWPDLAPCFDIKFFRSIKAVAWHPQMSGLLCIGGRKNGSLSLWNVNTSKMTTFVSPKFNGCVENLAWNKLSGELVVHWTYREGDNRYTIVPVLASFNQIVDVLPLDKETQLSFLKFNSTHEQLIAQCANVCSLWNFFGNEKLFRRRCMPLYSSTWRRQGVMVHNPIR